MSETTRAKDHIHSISLASRLRSRRIKRSGMATCRWCSRLGEMSLTAGPVVLCVCVLWCCVASWKKLLWWSVHFSAWLTEKMELTRTSLHFRQNTFADTVHVERLICNLIGLGVDLILINQIHWQLVSPNWFFFFFCYGNSIDIFIFPELDFLQHEAERRVLRTLNLENVWQRQCSHVCDCCIKGSSVCSNDLH